MANTLKFGNGNWATKDGSTLAYNDESGFNPLPFDFTRASSATVVNKNGLIETVASGIPRIDFLGNTKGALLLEPSRTNLIAQSQAFDNSYWTKSGASIQGDASTAGAEQVVNGNFATDSDWTKGTSWTISGGTANCDGTSTSALVPTVSLSPVVGKSYQITYTISNFSSGFLRFYFGGIFTSFKSANGTYTETITVNAVDSLSTSIQPSTILSIDNVSVKEVQGFASPSADSPLGAFKLVEDTSNGGHNIQRVENVSNATIYTSSVFVKYGGREWIRFTDAQSSNRIHFNTLTGAFGAITGTVIDYNSIALSNGWYKLSITTTSVATAYALRVSLAEADNDVSYTGDGTSGVYIYGAQLEAGSYSTSLINTSGSVVTRQADVCNNGGNSEVINSTEGVLYADIAALTKINPSGNITLTDGTGDNRIYIYYLIDNSISVIYNVNSTGASINNFSLSNITDQTKIAVRWGNSNVSVWINGTSVLSNTTSNFLPNTLNVLSFEKPAGSVPFEGKTKDVRVYNTALSDSELAALTTI